MKKLLALLLSVAMSCAGALDSTGGLPVDDSGEVARPAVQESVTFADRLNEEMPRDKNYVFSPLSIKMALAMAANGASGETQAEILRAIDVEDLGRYDQTVREMLDQYSQSDILRLNIANSIWLNTDQTSQQFSADFTQVLARKFDATSDLVTNRNAARKINGWVEEKTQGKIPAILTEQNADFGAMLVNAVYFKGAWASPFNEDSTRQDTFTARDGTKKTVDFMNRTDYMSYAQVDGVTVVALPYRAGGAVLDENGEYRETKWLDGVDVSMYLLLADGDYSPEAVLDRARFSTAYIQLSVPKFEFAYSAELTEPLKALGVDRAFTDGAEFENMFDQGTMRIDQVLHKAYIKVGEEGTEAAAVTAVGMATSSAMPPEEPVPIRFDRPFTFVIRDNISGETLFLGEYAFPN